jgi:hypothetical protein
METPNLTTDEKLAIANRIFRLVSELNRAISDATSNKINTALFAEVAPSAIPGVAPQPILKVNVYEHIVFEDQVTPKPAEPTPNS